MEKIRVYLPYIEKILSSKTSLEFESIVTFILDMSETSFNPTRQSRDGGVDSVKYEGNREMTFYSIYGPNTFNWKLNGKKKVDEDANSVKKILEEHPDKELKAWKFIVNCELSAEQILYIRSKFNNPNLVKIITPKSLIGTIAMEDKYVLAVNRYLGAADYDEPADVLDLNLSSSLKYLLKQISNLEKLEDEKEVKEKIDTIIEKIIQISLNELDIDKKEDYFSFNKEYFNIDEIISDATKIKSSQITHFLYIKGTFIDLNSIELKESVEINKKELSEVYSHPNKNFIVFTPQDFLPVYEMCTYLKSQIENSNNNFKISKNIRRVIKNYLVKKANNEIFIYPTNVSRVYALIQLALEEKDVDLL